MKFPFLAGLFFAIGISATPTANAYDGIVTECTACNSDAIFRQNAKYYYDMGNVTLYNLRTGTIHAYQFSLKRGYQNQVDPPLEAIEVNEVAVNPSVYNAFANVSGFYQASGLKLQAAITIPYTDLGPNVPGLNQGTSAYDVTEDANLRNRIGIEIANNRDKWNQVRSFMNKVDQTMLMLLGLRDEAVLEVRVTFADGSSALYRISSRSTNSTKLEYVPGSATTPRSQLIPDTNQPQNQGTWVGPNRGGDDMGRFGQHMNAIGASTDWSYRGGDSNPQEVRCTWKASQSGNTLVCAASAY